MAAPFFNILQKCDLAVVAYLISEGAGTAGDVFPSKRSQGKTLPCTIVESKSAKPAIDANPYSGVYRVECSVYVRTKGSADSLSNQFEQPATDAADRVAKTWDAFHTNLDQAGDTLANLINTAASGILDFAIQNAEVKEIRAGFEAKGDAWCDIIDLEFECSALSDV